MRRRKVTHFSHRHPLHETKTKEEDRNVCSACEVYISGSAYKCKDRICNFFLHKACFELPRAIRHKSHHAHPLTLRCDAHEFTCKACGGDSDRGFTYHCSTSTCDYDLHTKCASLPETVSREDLHHHPITLCYSVVYDEKDTQLVCDVCDDIIHDGCWVYCCSYCDFGIHLDCASATTTKAKAAEQEAAKEGEQEQEETAGGGSNDPMAPMDSFLEAQLQMQRFQLQMETSRQHAQMMRDYGRGMVYLAPGDNNPNYLL